MRKAKSGWLLLLFLIIGSFIGSLLGQAFGGSLPFLTLSSHAYSINPPLVLSLDLVTLTFGFSVKMTVSGVIGLLLGALVYSRL